MHLKINVSAAQAHIDALKAKGYIARVGGTRGHWQTFYHFSHKSE